MRILVLEIDEDVIKTLKALLKMGHKVYICKSGSDCTTVLKMKEFDLLMVDVEIVNLAGLETVIALRTKERGTGKHLPVVALGEIPGSGRIPGMETGFDHELRKPVQIPNLLELMDKLSTRPPATIQEAPRQETPRQEAPKPPPPKPPPPKVSENDRPSDSNPPINEKAALALCDGDEEFYHEIAQVFVLDAITHLEKLKNALKNKDVDLTQRHAHALKGASGNVCAENFLFFAMQIERAAKNKDLSQTDPIFADLHKEYLRIKEFVAKVMPG